MCGWTLRRVTRHRIPGPAGRNSEEISGPTGQPRSESAGEKSMSVKRLRPESVVGPVSARPARYGESWIA